jgi:hypothetical protein
MSLCHGRHTSRQFNTTLQSFTQGSGLPLRDALDEALVNRIAAEEAMDFGGGPGDVYSAALVLWAFVTQMISKDPSCLAAVTRIGAALVAVGREPCALRTGAYCKARQKLAEKFLRRLTITVGQGVEDNAPDAWRWQGRRTLLVDGATISAPDTPANQQTYPQPRTQKKGCGFPLLRMVVLLTLATAVLVDAAYGPYRGKETGETALLRTLFDSVRAGDVIVADRYYCSYWMLALLPARGADCVFRLHQLRLLDFPAGVNDQQVVWQKPQRPQWMNAADYAAMPASLTLRAVRTKITQPGFRVKELVVVTTLTDVKLYSQEALVDLYHKRWHVELDLRAMKTSLQMDILRCKTPAMLHKEIWAHLLAYNLTRKVMAQAAIEAGINPRAISFMATVQTLNAFREQLLNATPEELERLAKIIFAAVATRRVGNRPDRSEPRVVKRRPKSYPLMRKPRAVLRAELLAADHQVATKGG